MSGLVVCATKAYLASMMAWHRIAIWTADQSAPTMLRLRIARSFHLEPHTCKMAACAACHSGSGSPATGNLLSD